MSIAATENPGARHDFAEPRAQRAPALRVEVHDDFAAARAPWLALQASGHATPYQRFDWAEAYFRHVEAADGARLRLVTCRDRAGDVALILPLAVRSHGPVTVARFLGGKHANFNMPVFSLAAANLDPASIRAALQEAGRQAGVDLFALTAQPRDWEGVANPMAGLGGQDSAGAGYKFALAPDGEALLTGKLSKDTRKKLRQKEAKLAQIGPVAYVRPASTAQAREMLAAFLTFKSQRFQSQGIDDPFAGEAVRRFLEEAVAIDAAGQEPPAELHALKAGERIVAVYGAVRGGGRFCGQFTAFDSAPDIARSTPGDILLMAMIRQACRDGLATFDLGVGEARYKMQVCDQREALFDSMVAVNLKGRVAARAMALALAAKRRAKASPLVTRAVASLRKLRATAS